MLPRREPPDVVPPHSIWGRPARALGLRLQGQRRVYRCPVAASGGEGCVRVTFDLRRRGRLVLRTMLGGGVTWQDQLAHWHTEESPAGRLFCLERCHGGGLGQRDPVSVVLSQLVV